MKTALKFLGFLMGGIPERFTPEWLDWSSDASIDLLAKLEPGYYWLENVSKVDGIAVRRVIEVVRIEVGRVWGKHWVGPGTYLVTGDYLTGIGVLASWSGVRLEKVKSPEFASG